MQIVVPAAGRGSRFQEQGYTEPKPLIEVVGKPLIKWSTDGLLGITDPRYIFLVLQEHIDDYQIDQKLSQLYSGAQVIPVQGVTAGAAATVLLAKDALDPEEDLAIVNCDNLFLINFPYIQERLLPNAAGAVFYFASLYDRWSYSDIDKDGLVHRVVEKEVISDRATVGCYYFTKARYFIEAAEYMIAHDLRSKGEFYVSPSYNILIEQGHTIQGFPCDLSFSLGTPEEVKNFVALFDPAHSQAHVAAQA